MNTTKKLQQAKLDQWAVLCKEQSEIGRYSILKEVLPTILQNCEKRWNRSFYSYIR